MLQEKVDYGWPAFALRLILAVAYVAIASAASTVLSAPQAAFSQTVRCLAAVAALAPLLAFSLAQIMFQRFQDEYERRLTAHARAWAAQTALLGGLLLIAAAQIMPTVRTWDVMNLAAFFVLASVLMRQMLKFRRVKS